VFPEDGEVLSGGNFHGQPLALALDFLAIAVSELANISERRIEQLVNPALSDLEPFLVKNPGLNSGLMIAQYTAASLVSENKILSSPASVDSIPSSANQEDHVSMGSISARKLYGILENTRNVLAIELMCAAQAIDLSESTGRLSESTKKTHNAIRRVVPPLEKDRVIYTDIEKIVALVANEDLH
jgi:histidine ammonia-lyase